jgi:hypothetical protein
MEGAAGIVVHKHEASGWEWKRGAAGFNTHRPNGGRYWKWKARPLLTGLHSLGGERQNVTRALDLGMGATPARLRTGGLVTARH